MDLAFRKYVLGIFLLLFVFTISCTPKRVVNESIDPLGGININGQYSFNGNRIAKIVQVGNSISLFFDSLKYQGMEAKGQLSGDIIVGQWQDPAERAITAGGWNYFHAKILENGEILDLSGSADSVSTSMSLIKLLRD